MQQAWMQAARRSRRLESRLPWPSLGYDPQVIETPLFGASTAGIVSGLVIPESQARAPGRSNRSTARTYDVQNPTAPQVAYGHPETPPAIWLALGIASLLLMSQVGCSMSARGRNLDGARHFQSGRFNEAIQSFQRALVSNPNDANAYYNLASTYHVIGKQNTDSNWLRQSEGLYHQCLDLSPNHVDCHRGLAALLVDTNRPESAFTLMKRWSARNPQLADPKIELARLYEEFGDKDSAERELTSALYVEANNTRAWTALGQLRESQGQLAQALTNYQQAYNLNNRQPGVAQRIASLQQSINLASRTGQPTQMGSVPHTTR
jgi:Flp pilus assembly protein TadD